MGNSVHKINYGEIRDVFQNESTARFEWRIPDYLILTTGTYKAPTVRCFNMFWNLEIHRLIGDIFESVKLRREIATCGTLESVRLTLFFKNAGGSEEDIVRDETLPEASEDWNQHRALPDRKFFSSNERSITCIVWKDKMPYSKNVAHETQTEDGSCTTGRNDEHHLKDFSILSEDFKNLLISGTGHDVLIRVKDKQFSAHKCVLQARSPVFTAIFSNKMAEGADDSVSIDDCDPDVFAEFLQYVYTGKADVSSTSRALGLYYAGDKYHFSGLKELCVNFLRNSITTTTISDIISLAAVHGEKELLQQAIVHFSKNLEEVMQTTEWQRFFSDNPILGNEMCLKAVQCLMTTSYKT